MLPHQPLRSCGAHALTAAPPPTTPTTARPTLFVPLGALKPLLALAQHPPSYPITQPRQPISPQVAPFNLPAVTTTSIVAPVVAAGSGTSALSAGTAPTSNGTAPSIAPIETQRLVSPIRPLILECELATHPDNGFVRQLLHNITHGCNIGYDGPHFLHTAPHLPTTYTHPHIIDAAIAKECTAGRLAGPYTTPPLPHFRCSGLGVVPKKDGSWRVIYHLSAPHSRSINDFIDPSRFSLSYCTVDHAIAIINKLGPRCLLGKIDLKNAFRLIPVRRQDWHLLGIQWQGSYYVDKCLLFGLRSAPYLFNLLTEAMEWILTHNYGVGHLIHYLDDFFTAGEPNSTTCSQHMSSIVTRSAPLSSLRKWRGLPPRSHS